MENREQPRSIVASTSNQSEISRSSDAEAILRGAASTAAANARRSEKPLHAHLATIPAREHGAATEADARATERKSLERGRRARDLFDASGVPARYREARIDSFDHLPEAVRAQYEAKATSLIQLAEKPVIIALSGPRGPGKTYMACALVRRFCVSLLTARYSVTMDYFSALKREYGKQGGDESRVERQFEHPSLLVLDEIQVRGDTDWENRMLTRLIDRRYADLKTTVLITNETSRQFQMSVGDSIANRIFDGGAIIDCGWKSLRGIMEAV